MQADSVDKIVTSYFSTVTAEPFTYRDVRYPVPELVVSPLLLRGYTCPIGCGGCCPKFSLDYLPTERKPPGVTARTVMFNGHPVTVYSDMQLGNRGDRCRNLQVDGRCGIYLVRPFSCDFELIRMMPTGERARRLSQQLFSRGWNMKRTDGGRGAKCEMTPPDEYTVSEVLRKLTRLEDWARHFGLATRVPQIMTWVAEIDPANAPPLRFAARQEAGV